MRLSSNPSFYSPRGLDRWGVLRRLGRLHLLALLAAAVGGVLFFYLVNGSVLLLIAAVALCAIGVDGLLRTDPAGNLRSVRDTALYLFVPVTFTLGAGVFFRYTVTGYWTLPAAIVSGVLLAAVLYAEYRSVNAPAEELISLRLILNLAAYLAAFALYTALYNQRLPLFLASLLVGIVSFLIGVDVFRDLELGARPLLVYGATLGFIMAQTRWALNFIPLTGWLGGVFILVVFYVASQLMQAYLGGRLDRRVATEFAVVSAIGAFLVIVGRVLSAG